MKIPKEGTLLRVLVGESTRWQGRPAYEAIVLKARELHLAGATVLRGVMGYGASSRLHTAGVLALSDDLPMIVEIVDSREKIDALLPVIDAMLDGGLVTLERAEVLWYRPGRDAGESDRPPIVT